MKRIYLILTALIIFGLTSCETDIELNAEPADITVVYGLLDPDTNVNYVKINKAFLGSQSALDLASNSANFNYADGDLTVRIDEYNSSTGNSVSVKTLTRTVDEVIKADGIFDNTDNVLFRYDNTVSENNKYKLYIHNNVLDKDIISETEIVNQITISKPSKQSKFNFKNNLGTFLDKEISVTTGKHMRRVSATLIFSYKEFTGATTFVMKTVRIAVGEKKSPTDNGNEKIEFVLTGETFFDAIISAVPAVSGIKREVSNISMEFSVAGTELNTFMEVNEPSNTVVQIKPSYTNIENGIGIFSSRTKYLWETTISDPALINVHNQTVGALNQLGLGFCYDPGATGIQHKCP